MPVKEIMNHTYPPIYVDELAMKARAVLRYQNLRVLPIVDENDELVGIVDREDVVKSLV